MNDEKNKNIKKIIFVVIAIILLAIILYFCYTKIDSSEGETSDRVVSDYIDTDDGDEKISWDSYSTTNLKLTETTEISSPGIYNLTGTISDGYINVTANGNVKLILNGVSITNSSGPAIVVKNTVDDIVIELAEGSTNSLTDGKTYASSFTEEDGVIYSKSDLTFQGTGELNITANYLDGIVGKDDLKIIEGTYNITSADDAIRGKDSVYILGGTFNINSSQDGIKSTNDTDEGKGFVYITGGSFEISAGDDGIHAEQQILIEGEDININITESYEGIEAPIITINSGIISIVSSDDGINVAGGNDYSGFGGMDERSFSQSSSSYILTINGGDIYVNANGDGIDVNGGAYIYGGTIIVDGPADSANGALDYNTAFEMYGGTLVAVGASGMAQSASSGSEQYCVSIGTSTYSAGSTISITDSNGNEIISHTSAKSFSSIVASSPNFKNGETYTVTINGTEETTFTISSILTTAGSSTGGMNGGGRNNDDSGMKGSDFDNSGSTPQGGEDIDNGEMQGGKGNMGENGGMQGERRNQ